jgi:hypothetical protein
MKLVSCEVRRHDHMCSDMEAIARSKEIIHRPGIQLRALLNAHKTLNEWGIVFNCIVLKQWILISDEENKAIVKYKGKVVPVLN